MFADDDDDSRIYRVVVNHEEQYSIWLAEREAPAGWRDAGKSGTRADCLEHIKMVWTDMRPLSVRESLKRASQPV
jgi:MbtH protein